MLLFQAFRVYWLSNHIYQGIQYQATALDYRTKYLLEDDMDVEKYNTSYEFKSSSYEFKSTS